MDADKMIYGPFQVLPGYIKIKMFGVMVTSVSVSPLPLYHYPHPVSITPLDVCNLHPSGTSRDSKELDKDAPRLTP